jgi:hypothetical protein
VRVRSVDTQPAGPYIALRPRQNRRLAPRFKGTRQQGQAVACHG